MLTVCIELNNFAPTQSTVMNFNGYCRVGEKYLAINSDGIYSILSSDQADGTDIDAYFKLPRTDFGIKNYKRLRSLYVGYEADGQLQFTITADESISSTYTLEPIRDNLKQHGSKINVSRKIIGRYFDLKIENVNGCDFSIDTIDATVIVLGRRPRMGLGV